MSNTPTVQSLYAAFGRSDLPAIIDTLADDVEWNHEMLASADCPWNGNFSGKANVPGFFSALADNLDFTLFEPRDFIESGATVVALLRIESIVKRTGSPLRNDSVHVWSFDEHGKVARYRHYNDTAAELNAWGELATR